jgi:hypothetical protein
LRNDGKPLVAPQARTSCICKNAYITCKKDEAIAFQLSEMRRHFFDTLFFMKHASCKRF